MQRQLFINFRDVDERHAALSYAGLVPAALMGLDVNDLLARTLRMQDACAACVPLRENTRTEKSKMATETIEAPMA